MAVVPSTTAFCTWPKYLFETLNPTSCLFSSLCTRPLAEVTTGSILNPQPPRSSSNQFLIIFNFSFISPICVVIEGYCHIDFLVFLFRSMMVRSLMQYGVIFGCPSKFSFDRHWIVFIIRSVFFDEARHFTELLTQNFGHVVKVT